MRCHISFQTPRKTTDKGHTAARPFGAACLKLLSRLSRPRWCSMHRTVACCRRSRCMRSDGKVLLVAMIATRTPVSFWSCLAPHSGRLRWSGLVPTARNSICLVAGIRSKRIYKPLVVQWWCPSPVKHASSLQFLNRRPAAVQSRKTVHSAPSDSLKLEGVVLKHMVEVKLCVATDESSNG